MRYSLSFMSAALALSAGLMAPSAEAQSVAAAPTNTVMAPAAVASGAVVPPSYVIGPDDVLSILFWREKDLSVEELIVRPDGKITLPLLNDLQAAGRTPEQLRAALVEVARKYVEDPNPTVIVKEIKSRKVFITGQVEKPGTYPLIGTTTILQLIATAGGLREFVDGKKISVRRTENGAPMVHEFNYQDLLKKKNLRQDIELRPGDVVIVP
jgi:polysaccharide export outer membrane protein